MKYEVALAEDDGFVRITVHEPITAALQLEFAAEAIAVAQKARIKRYLADVTRVRNTAGTFDQYHLAYEELPPMGIVKGSRIAIVVEQDDQSHDFIETLFCNVGFDCRLFITEETAISWLKK